MLRSCQYCGRIHDSRYDCEKRPQKFKKKYEHDAFRSTSLWQRKADEIKERDNYLCQICIRGLYGSRTRINSKNLSVHHAVPLKTDFDLRLSSNNLITLCGKHHEMAEKGEIPLAEVLAVIQEQEGIPRGYQS